jgi:hypothetical protein
MSYPGHSEAWRVPYRICIDDPTARGAANFFKTICEAIEGLQAATAAMLAL